MNLTWQLTGDDEWDFGEMVRGMVRNVRAQIYFDEDYTGTEGGWVWLTIKDKPSCEPSPRGRAIARWDAVRQVEEALGILGTEVS